MATIIQRLRDIANELEQLLTPNTEPELAWVDLRDTLPHNSSPDNPDWRSGTDWLSVKKRRQLLYTMSQPKAQHRKVWQTGQQHHIVMVVRVCHDYNIISG